MYFVRVYAAAVWYEMETKKMWMVATMRETLVPVDGIEGGREGGGDDAMCEMVYILLCPFSVLHCSRQAGRQAGRQRRMK